MPANSRAKNQNKSLKRLPETIPDTFRCLKVYIPDDIEYVGYLLGAIGRLSQQVFYDRDEEHTAKVVADLWKQANQLTMAALPLGCGDSPPITETPPTYFYDPPTSFQWQGIQCIDDCIIINEGDCEMPIYVNGCGCGCGGNGGVGGGIPDNGNPTDPSNEGESLGVKELGAVYGDYITDTQNSKPVDGYGITDCDWVTGGGLDYMLDQQKEMLNIIDGAGDNIDTLIGLFAAAVNTLTVGVITPKGIEELAEITAEMANNAIELWIDTDFREAVKLAWLKAFPNSQVTTRITREALYKMTKNLRRIWLVGQYPIEARTLMQLLIAITDMGKLNLRFRMWAGDCDQSDYSYYKAQAQQYWQPPTDPNLAVPPSNFDADWGVYWDMRVSLYEWTVFQSNGGFVAGQGVKSGSSNATDYQIYIRNGQLQRQLTGVRIYLDAGMGGLVNRVRIVDSAVGNLYDQSAVIANPIDVALDDVITGDLGIWLAEYEYANSSADNFTKYIQRIEVWGKGNLPAVGTEIT